MRSNDTFHFIPEKKIRIQENGVLGNRENQVFVHDQISAAAAAAFDNGQIFVQIIIES